MDSSGLVLSVQLDIPGRRMDVLELGRVDRERHDLDAALG